MNLFIATDNGVIVAKYEASWQVVNAALDGCRVTSVTCINDVALAGTRDGIYRSVDGGLIWREASQGLEIRHIRWLASHTSITGIVLAGTEPAGIFVSHDGGNSWQGRPEVSMLRDQLQWSLPYSPEAGCVRGFALHGNQAYAAVEVGGVLISDDAGSHWQLAAGSSGDPSMRNLASSFIHPDVHSILVHPTSSDLVFAPTGGGFYRSIDGGRTWELLYRCYCRAAWVDPQEADHILLGPADWVDQNGRIEESIDGGKSWSNPFKDLQTPWPRHMVERFTQVGDQLMAVLSNGELLATATREIHWSRILPELSVVNAVCGTVD